MFDWMCMFVQGGQRPVFWLLVFHFWSSRNHIWYNDNIFSSNLFYESSSNSCYNEVVVVAVVDSESII